MSRRSRRRRKADQAESSAYHPSTRSLTSLLVSPFSQGSWLDVEDRRRHHPLGEAQHPRTFKGTRARIQVKNKFSRPHKMAGFSVAGVPKKIAFKAPKQVLLCVRREQRKEVLFALMKTGKGAKSPRRRNRYSEISCKR